MNQLHTFYSKVKYQSIKVDSTFWKDSKYLIILLLILQIFSAKAQNVTGYTYSNYSSINGGVLVGNNFTVAYTGGSWNTRATVAYDPVTTPSGLTGYSKPTTMLELGAWVSSNPGVPPMPTATYTFASPLSAGTVMFIQDVDALESYRIEFLDASGNLLNPASIGTYNLSSPARSAVTFNSTNLTVTATDNVNYSESLSTFVISSSLVKQIRITEIASRDDLSASGTAEFYFASSPVANPVKLSYFKGIANPNEIALTWQTEVETNSRHFVVQRSGNSVEFGDLGIINSAGEATEKTNYKYIDKNPFVGINYYRLRQVDNDGSITYSKIIDINSEDGVSETIIHPNPSEGSFMIKTKEPILSSEAYNSSGKSVEIKLEKQGNSYTVNFDKTPESGLYFLKVRTESGIKNYRFVIQ